jgi:hypothetical protein
MTEILARLQRVFGGESRAVIVATVAALVFSAILAIAIFNGLMALLLRLPAMKKDKCPSCRRRALAVCWCDESDEDGVEYVYSRCAACGKRYRALGAGAWEDASAPEFDVMYRGNDPC